MLFYTSIWDAILKFATLLALIGLLVQVVSLFGKPTVCHALLDHSTRRDGGWPYMTRRHNAYRMPVQQLRLPRSADRSSVFRLSAVQ
jgi:hypothetical protein